MEPFPFIQYASFGLIALSILWLLVFNKKMLFWFWLWQKKEYHMGRMKAHLRAPSGRKLFVNASQLLKIFALVLLVSPIPLSFTSLFFAVVFVALYFLEGGKALLDVARGRWIVPIMTVKTKLLMAVLCVCNVLFLIILSLALLNIPHMGTTETFFLIWVFALSLFSIDIFIPVLATLIVGIAHLGTLVWRKRLIDRAKQKRDAYDALRVIGITGSYGKTSTKELLAHLLLQKYGKEKVLKTQEHKNSEVGIASTIVQELQESHEFFVCEMAAYSKGGIALLADMVRPHVALLTGVNEQHVGVFGSMEHLLSAEGGKELIAKLPDHGTLIVNAENALTRQIATAYARTRSDVTLLLCGTLPADHVRAEHVREEKEAIMFDMIMDEERYEGIRIPFKGKHHVQNILVAAAASRVCGMKGPEIVQGLSSLLSDQDPMKHVHNEVGWDILDTSYSANPTGVLSHLEYLSTLPGKKVVVMPCLIELGSFASDIHRNIGKRLVSSCDLAIITTDDHLAELQQGGGKEKIVHARSPSEVVQRIREVLGTEGTVLIEGRSNHAIIRAIYHAT